MAVARNHKAPKGKSRKEVLELIKKTPEHFSLEFAAFYELETQSIEISKALVKYLKVDKDDMLLAHINHVKLEAHKALKKSVYSLLDYCGEINFSNYILNTGISVLYKLIDFDHETPDDANNVLSELLQEYSKSKNHLFTRDIGMLIGSHSALDSTTEAILSLLESQRVEKPNRDLAWQHIAIAHNYLGQIGSLEDGDQIDIEAEIKNAISDSKRKAAFKRLEKDPKQDAKEAIKLEWSVISKSKKTHGWKAQFSNRMQTKFPIIEDVETIKGWVRRWEQTLPS